MRPALTALLIAAAFATPSYAQAPTEPLRLLVPLYSYPGVDDPGAFGRVAAGSALVPVTVIVNPCSGPIDPTVPHPPNTCDNVDYAQHLLSIDTLRSGDPTLRILGYVATGRLMGGEVDAQRVRDAIDVYAAHYDLDGIFFDEAATTADRAADYRALCRYAKDEGEFDEVVLNPGTAFHPDYLAGGDCDAAVALEDYLDGQEGWATYALPPELRGFPPHRLGVLLHDAFGEGAMLAALDSAATRGFGLVYVTDDTHIAPDSNEWNELADYWTAEVNHLAAINATVSAEGPPTVTPRLRLSVAPNPASGPLAVSVQAAAGTTARIEVRDALGRHVLLLYEGLLHADETRFVLETASLSPGPYVIRLATPAGETATRIVVTN